MSLALIVIVLAVLWAAMTGGFTLLNLLLGVGVGLIAIYLTRDRFAAPAYLGRLGRIIALSGLFLREILLSAVRVGLLVLSPNLHSRLRPAIIAFPLTATSDAEITLLANLITLTPGTLSVDVSEDRRYLYVHALSVTDKAALIRHIASGFERRVIEVFK
jgi:multicomponent Na+:H+ antiporter subunit E